MEEEYVEKIKEQIIETVIKACASYDEKAKRDDRVGIVDNSKIVIERIIDLTFDAFVEKYNVSRSILNSNFRIEIKNRLLESTKNSSESTYSDNVVSYANPAPYDSQVTVPVSFKN